LDREEAGLVLKACILIPSVRLGLAVLPYRAVLRLLAPLSRVADAPSGPPTEAIERIVWAVALVARHSPRSTCLVQALAARVLLRRAGVSADLRIGVARNAGSGIQAHAWVESNGAVVLGASSTEFAPFQGDQASISCPSRSFAS